MGDASHDLMGFTAAGPDDLLASGHVDLRVDQLQVEGEPPLLGLVRSADGERWESVSLLGEADFHSLEAAHDHVFGYGSTNARFMVSEDLKHWDTRVDGISLIDFAVSPSDADVIVATVQGGVERSRDGGRTWKRVSTEPLVFADWAGQGLCGVRANGELVVSTDDASNWESRRKLDGQPEALHVATDAIYAAVTEQGIVRSVDAGETFTVTLDTSGCGQRPNASQ